MSLFVYDCLAKTLKQERGKRDLFLCIPGLKPNYTAFVLNYLYPRRGLVLFQWNGIYAKLFNKMLTNSTRGNFIFISSSLENIPVDNKVSFLFVDYAVQEDHWLVVKPTLNDPCFLCIIKGDIIYAGRRFTDLSPVRCSKKLHSKRV